MTFAIDENSILTVTARDKGSGKKEAMTVANDKGRLNRDQIEKMIKDSERFAEQDKKVRERIEAKKSLEDYINSMKSTISDSEGLSRKLSRAEISTIEDGIRDEQEWMESNEDATKEDFDYHLQELQNLVNPIISKVYKPQGGKGQKGGDDEDFDGDL